MQIICKTEPHNNKRYTIDDRQERRRRATPAGGGTVGGRQANVCQATSNLYKHLRKQNAVGHEEPLPSAAGARVTRKFYTISNVIAHKTCAVPSGESARERERASGDKESEPFITIISRAKQPFWELCGNGRDGELSWRPIKATTQQQPSEPAQLHLPDETPESECV